MIRIEEIIDRIFEDPEWSNVNELFKFFDGGQKSSPFPLQPGKEIESYRIKINESLEDILKAFNTRFGPINEERAKIARAIATEWNRSLVELRRTQSISQETFEKYSSLLDRLYDYLQSNGASVGKSNNDLPTFRECVRPKYQKFENEIIGILKDAPRDTKGRIIGKSLITNDGAYKKQHGSGTAFRLFWELLQDNEVLIPTTGLDRDEENEIFSKRIPGLPLNKFTNQITDDVRSIYTDFFSHRIQSLIIKTL